MIFKSAIQSSIITTVFIYINYSRYGNELDIKNYIFSSILAIAISIFIVYIADKYKRRNK